MANNDSISAPRIRSKYWVKAGLLLLLLMPLGGFAQVRSKTVSISFKDKPLTTILDYISDHTDHRVTYEDEVKAYNGVVTVSFDRATPVQAVQEILKGSPFTYDVKGKSIHVLKLKSNQSAQHLVQGTVYDADGLPIPGATVRVPDENVGSLSDLDGKFSIKVAKQTGKIVVSYVGYETYTGNYSAGKDQKITLKESVNVLGEVAVIAYGTRNTRELTGAVGSIKSEKLQDMPAPSIETLLQGQLSGVEVSNLSGTPGGGGSQVTIRGFSSLNQQGINDGSPLYVIDGVPVTASTGIATGGINPLSSLDPTTIESVEVLKDAASASLYGSRAANGVILITTKKGKSGKAEVNVSVTNSISWLPETPTQMMGNGERIYHLLAAKSYVEGHYDWMTESLVTPKSHKDSYGWGSSYDGMYDYLWRNGARLSEFEQLPAIAQDSLNTFYNNRSNWWDYIFRLGRVTDADINATGGTDNARYMIGGGLYDETGIMIGSSFKRFSFVTNLDLNLTSKLSMYTNLALGYTSKNAGADMGKVQGLTVDPKLSSTMLPGRGTEIEAETLRRLRDIDQKNSNYNIRLNVGMKYDILKGLTLNSSAAVNHFQTKVNVFTPDYLNYDKLSSVSVNRVGMSMLQTEHILNYKNTFARDHAMEVMGGVTYNYDVLDLVNGEGRGGPTNQIHQIGEGWPSIQTDEYGTTRALQKIQTNFEEQAMLSFLARVNYNYRQKYLLDLSVRRDGSSVFGSNVRWGNFPAAGLGWVFSKEGFAHDWWWLSFGKMRASWGRSGQKFQEAYLAHGLMSESNTFFGKGGLIPALMANDDLTWEKSDQLDLGLDLELFNYRVKLTLDYYNKYSYALLMQTPMPGDVYFADKMWNNSSAISNEGIEFSVQADVIRTEDFRWQMMFNISRNWNLFRESYDGVDMDRMILGRPLYGVYAYKDEGYVQREADIPYYYDSRGVKKPLLIGGENNPLQIGARKLKDQNMDGRIDDQDLYYAGSTLPKAYGGFSNQLTWKGFSLFLHMNYSIGRKVVNQVKASALAFSGSFGPIMEDYTHKTFWEKEGDVTDYPSLKFASSGYRGQFDGMADSAIENVSFVRLKQATLSYTLPKEWLSNIGVKGMRVHLTGENLFMLSNYSGLDPEVIDPSSGKDDGRTYPLSRKVSLGLNLNF